MNFFDDENVALVFKILITAAIFGAAFYLAKLNYDECRGIGHTARYCLTAGGK